MGLAFVPHPAPGAAGASVCSSHGGCEWPSPVVGSKENPRKCWRFLKHSGRAPADPPWATVARRSCRPESRFPQGRHCGGGRAFGEAALHPDFRHGVRQPLRTGPCVHFRPLPSTSVCFVLRRRAIPEPQLFSRTCTWLRVTRRLCKGHPSAPGSDLPELGGPEVTRITEDGLALERPRIRPCL